MLILPVAHLVSRMKTSANARYLIAATLAVSFALFNLTSPRVIGVAAAEWAGSNSLVRCAPHLRRLHSHRGDAQVWKATARLLI